MNRFIGAEAEPEFDPKFDPTKIEPGWSHAKWEELKADLGRRFPELARRQAEIERTQGGQRQAWWYWKGIVRNSPVMGKWWFYALGTWIPDFDRVVLGEAKHVSAAAGLIVHFVTPEPVLDGILGLGPKVRVLPDIPAGATVLPGSNPVFSAIIPAVRVQGVGDAAEGLTMVVKAASTIGRMLGNLFGRAWKNSPPDKGKGLLAAQVMSPLFMLEVPFGNTRDTRQPTGVTPRTTDQVLDTAFDAGAGLIQQQKAFQQIRVQEAAKLMPLVQTAAPGTELTVRRDGGGGFVQASDAYAAAPPAPPAWPPWALPVGIGALGLLGLLAIRGASK